MIVLGAIYMGRGVSCGHGAEQSVLSHGQKDIIPRAGAENRGLGLKKLRNELNCRLHQK